MKLPSHNFSKSTIIFSDYFYFKYIIKVFNAILLQKYFFFKFSTNFLSVSVIKTFVISNIKVQYNFLVVYGNASIALRKYLKHKCDGSNLNRRPSTSLGWSRWCSPKSLSGRFHYKGNCLLISCMFWRFSFKIPSTTGLIKMCKTYPACASGRISSATCYFHKKAMY